ncbi:hypothetical protein Trydic_g16611 [Trypoxylus dichotomus]
MIKLNNHVVTRVIHKIKFPRSSSSEKRCYARSGVWLCSPSLSHHPSELSATLSLGLAAIRDRAPIRFSSQVRITLHVHDEQHSGRPSVSVETIAKVEEAVLKNRRMTARVLYEMIPDVSKDLHRHNSDRPFRACQGLCNVLKRPTNFFRPTKPVARSS